MTTHDTLLRAAIAERSSTHLAVYADWLEENGEPLALGFRLLAESGKWPNKTTHSWHNERWWNEHNPVNDGRTFADELEESVFMALEGWREYMTVDSGRRYETREAALTAAARAFEQIARKEHDTGRS